MVHEWLFVVSRSLLLQIPRTSPTPACHQEATLVRNQMLSQMILKCVSHQSIDKLLLFPVFQGQWTRISEKRSRYATVALDYETRPQFDLHLTRISTRSRSEQHIKGHTILPCMKSMIILQSVLSNQCRSTYIPIKSMFHDFRKKIQDCSIHDIDLQNSSLHNLDNGMNPNSSPHRSRKNHHCIFLVPSNRIQAVCNWSQTNQEGTHRNWILSRTRDKRIDCG
mmetsp:Transcript_10283/g.38192  ORF Transcript_10283/g.38192 Transcript_10283/m.38192 type:complete len:223 (-) Transcript_10283:2231-2899(-)